MFGLTLVLVAKFEGDSETALAALPVPGLFDATTVGKKSQSLQVGFLVKISPKIRGVSVSDVLVAQDFSPWPIEFVFEKRNGGL